MNRNYIFPITGMFFCACISASELKIGVGAGVVTPYEGAKKYILTPDAMIQYTELTDDYGIFSIGTEGAKWQYNIYDSINVGVIGTYLQGRKEEIGFSGNKNTDLKGMGDLKGAVAAGLEISYAINEHSLYINSLTAIGHRNYGGKKIDNATRYEFGINSNFELNNEWSIDSNVSIRYVNKNYNQAYFGVTEEQSMKTSYLPYTPNSGFKDVGVLFGVNYKLFDDLYLNLKSGGYYLLGDSVNSPIVKQKYGLINMIGITYSF
ncbi:MULTISPECIES: MipA/OmpV family protein [Providencia]|uniref:MipA/OmpV family protein n=1 Tax=Providencia TaxID=586 RepID=UPI0019D02102|nr:MULTISPECIES: MipA/OmpV family protein [Providencia]MBN6363273.1 MipA/OmpV family protein [Providencia huaxiensis]